MKGFECWQLFLALTQLLRGSLFVFFSFVVLGLLALSLCVSHHHGKVDVPASVPTLALNAVEKTEEKCQKYLFFRKKQLFHTGSLKRTEFLSTLLPPLHGERTPTSARLRPLGIPAHLSTPHTLTLSPHPTLPSSGGRTLCSALA